MLLVLIKKTINNLMYLIKTQGYLLLLHTQYNLMYSFTQTNKLSF